MSYYGNIDSTKNHKMDREEEEDMDIYENVNPISISAFRTESENSDTRHQTPQHTGSDSEKIKSSRAAPLCLVLLCFLLLTAVIVLSVYIYTNNTNYTQDRRQLLTNITNLSEESVELLTNITSLKEEREQLLTNITNLSEESVELLTNITSLKEDRDQLHAKHMQLTRERDGLSSNNRDLIKQRDQLNQEKKELMKLMDEWIFYRSNAYYISDAKKSWTDSRSYCTARGADLVIINNKEEQDFVSKISARVNVWIGLTDSDKEGSWNWVDGSKQTSGFWNHGEPNGAKGKEEDCALIVSSRWADYPCNNQFQWICEKRIF